MIIAISSQGKDIESQVDPRFGRSRYFIIYDTDEEKYSVMDNIVNLSAAQGAGIQTAKNVADSGAKTVLSGNVGPKAFSVLEIAGIDVYTGASGKVCDVIKSFAGGALKKTDKPNVEGHWV